MRTYYEFFAGGGMARAGLGDGWQCLFANDFSPMKARTYKANWPGDHMVCDDVAKLKVADLPGVADLVWASFPCQDLSLAGDYRGLGRANSEVKTRSGTFWPFWDLMRALRKDGRAPALIVLENVLGALSSNNGGDFIAIAQSLAKGGYRFGALVIDAKLFLPQSRPRVFFVAVREDIALPQAMVCDEPSGTWAPAGLIAAKAKLTPALQRKWVWWRLPEPTAEPARFVEFVEDEPTGVRWHDAAGTAKLLNSMTPLNRRKVKEAMQSGERTIGTLYRRTRPEPDGSRRVRAEVRFDDVAGCLRTPAGGSSRQKLLVVEGKKVRSRLLSPREAARLMGLDDNYALPSRYNDAYHVVGDGVAVPVVRHLAAELLEPLMLAANPAAALAAE